MLMALHRLLLSCRGRIARATFWWAVILAGILFVVLFVILDMSVSYASTLVLYPPFAWVLAALVVKRMHDRGHSPAWLAAILIPVLGALWLVIELGLRRGTPGENQYGPDPLDFGTDYLTVK